MKSLSRSLVFFCLMLCSVVSFAGKSYCQGTITYADGSIKEGAIQFPLNAAKKTVTVKWGDGTVEKIASDLLTKLVVFYSDDSQWQFERVTIYAYNRKMTSLKPISKTEVWGVLLYEHEKLKYYVFGHQYNEHKTKQNHTVIAGAMTIHAFKRPDQIETVGLRSYFTDTSPIIGQEKYFQKAQKEYFKDTPRLANRINNGEFRKLSLEKLMEAYLGEKGIKRSHL